MTILKDEFSFKINSVTCRVCHKKMHRPSEVGIHAVSGCRGVTGVNSDLLEIIRETYGKPGSHIRD